MPTVQNTYPDNIAVAYEGQRATELDANIISRSVETAAGVAFGKAVTQGTEDFQCIAFAGTGSIIGITVRDQSVDPNDPNKFAENDDARIMTHGDIWVQASVAVDAGDSVYVTSGGEFTNASSGNTQITGARWDTSTSGAGLAIVRY